MFEVQTQNFGVSVEAVFQKPVSFREAQPETCAEKLVNFLHSCNLKATRLELYKRDSLYSYELNCAVYGESVKILLNSERFNLSFANGRTHADLQTIARALIGFSECFPLPDSGMTTNLYAHASFNSSALYGEYLSVFSVTNVNAELSGAIAYLKTKTWSEPVRFQVDRSQMLPSGLFLYWTTKLNSWPVTLDVINAIKESTNETSEVFGLKFGPLATI
ncbi:MAG: hypothetical protein ACLQVY_06995 [Limisphaerales bacterium]